MRQGNENKKVKIFRYVTKGTFDAYTWGVIESKQKFIGQVMTGKSPVRSIEDVDEAALSYAEVKMLATGDIRIKEKMDLDIQVAKLKMLKASHQAQQYEMQDKVRIYYPKKIKETQMRIDSLIADLAVWESHPVQGDKFSMTVMGTVYTERKEAGKAIIAACRMLDVPDQEISLGEYQGFSMKLGFRNKNFIVTLKQQLSYLTELSDNAVGNVERISNLLGKIPIELKSSRDNLTRLCKELESAKEYADRPFAQEEELVQKSARLSELNAELDHAEKGGRCGKDQEEIPVAQDLKDEPPSIIKSLKEYEISTPVRESVKQCSERDVI